VIATLPRVLGAQVANDKSALRKQLKHNKKILAEIRTTAGKLPKIAALAAKEVDALVFKHEARLNAALLQATSNGIPADTKEKLLESGIPIDLLLYVESAIQDGAFPKSVITVGGVRTSLFAMQLRNVSKARVQTGKSVTQMAQAFLKQLT